MAGRKKMNKDDKKHILTININDNILKKIDEIVEENNDIRSRLIERIIKNYINSKI